MDTMLQMNQSSGSTLTFCRAAVSGTVALASLVLASGRQGFDWLLGVPPAVYEALLRRAIATSSGRLSWKRHLVATTGGQSIATPVIQDGRRSWLDDLYAARGFL